MADSEARCIYFGNAGPENTERTLELAGERARQLGIRHVLVASSTGQTGALAAQMLRDLDVIVVSHSYGFTAPNESRFLPEHRQTIEQSGARILTCQHALGGIGRAVRRKLGTYQLDEIIAFTLRTLCDGIKVACEITVMAADAGLVPAGTEITAIGGTSSGADTAAVMRSANAQDFFDLRVLEIICKPRMGAMR